jgi:deoxycytidine triphosphate deaminase
MDPLAGARHQHAEKCDHKGDNRNSENEDEEALIGYLRKTCLPLGGEFVLHPRQFALAATLEYIRLPRGLAGHVVGRSRWARVGLIIAMATFVHPGYSGCLTLELQNLGDIPMRLSPGFPIAQLILEEAETDRMIDPGQLTCAIGPEFLPLLSRKDKRKLARLWKTHRILSGDEGWAELLAHQGGLPEQDSQSEHAG